MDVRKLMSPNTATNLRESKRNVLKDFVHVAGPLGVTHFLLLSATQNAAYLRVAKSPRGPTITMRIHEYSLIRDVLAAQQRPRAPQSMWLGPPLVVLNNFNSAAAPKTDLEHMRLATVMFQNLFPSIDATTTKLSSCQRVVLLDYNPATRRISLRHFSVAAAPTGVTKNLKTLLARKELPDMGNMMDVSEFLTRSGYGSESEGEEAEATRVEVETGGGRRRSRPNVRQSRIRLSEVGPRLELEIIKVEEGLCGGNVLFHRYVRKSKAEAAALQSKKELAAQEKEQRRRQQEENVRRKQAEKRRRQGNDGDKSAGGKRTETTGPRSKRKRKEWWEKNDAAGDSDGDDDTEWYRKEVGEAPDDEFERMQRRRSEGRRPFNKTRLHTKGVSKGKGGDGTRSKKEKKTKEKTTRSKG